MRTRQTPSRADRRTAEAGRWCFLAAGLAAIAAIVLVSAHHDLEHARHQRNLAFAAEHDHLARIDRHETFLNALAERDELLMHTLVRTQFDATTSLAAHPRAGDELGTADATFWNHLEPEPVARPAPPEPRSLLASLATDDRRRLWVIAVAGVLVLIGLLPTTPAPYRSA
ncbi:MAG: hypothetical protein AAF297_03760 [Planctomycetota bacterium]